MSLQNPYISLSLSLSIVIYICIPLCNAHSSLRLGYNDPEPLASESEDMVAALTNGPAAGIASTSDSRKPTGSLLLSCC